MTFLKHRTGMTASLWSHEVIQGHVSMKSMKGQRPVFSEISPCVTPCPHSLCSWSRTCLRYFTLNVTPHAKCHYYMYVYHNCHIQFYDNSQKIILCLSFSRLECHAHVYGFLSKTIYLSRMSHAKRHIHVLKHLVRIILWQEVSIGLQLLSGANL